MIRVLHGDCRDVLPQLEAGSVHCVVSSPPYYGLRDYGTAQWDGGDAACEHRQSARVPADWSTSGLQRNKKTPELSAGTVALVNHQQEPHYRDTCGKCGARRIDRQIGLEATPEEYLQTLVAVFREVRRVLRDDGTCWVNMGDSYASSGISGVQSTSSNLSRHGGNGFNPKMDGQVFGRAPTPSWAKPKDLLMMPARLALALQADGWWIRSAIVWAKPNPMPESVTDRPTSSYEMVYLLTKAARYYYDADAVREEPTGRTDPMGFARDHPPGTHGHTNGYALDAMKGRNCRNVWTLATEAFSAAHFATFPTALAERCIKAGTSEKGACPQCGAPWYRVMERGELVPTRAQYDKRPYGIVVDEPDANDQGRNRARDGHRANMAYENRTIGWHPTCGCDKCGPPVPCTVLDCFAGAGTTMLVADRLQRHAIGIELNADYARMSRNRIYADAPLLAEVAD